MTHRQPAFVVQTLGVKTNFPTAPRQFIYPKCESWARLAIINKKHPKTRDAGGYE